MITLLIDTHDRDILLAIYRDEILSSKIQIKGSSSHSEQTMPNIVKLLKQEQIDVHDLNDIVVVNGPGSFTGERLGVTIAKTLAYTLNIPIRTITSLEMYLNEELKDVDYLSLPEKNGYFIGMLDEEHNHIIKYEYLTEQNYQEFIKNHLVQEGKTFDINALIKHAHQKETLNPHEVNPFYVKKIEVEK